jgi:hypothetical protein
MSRHLLKIQTSQHRDTEAQRKAGGKASFCRLALSKAKPNIQLQASLQTSKINIYSKNAGLISPAYVISLSSSAIFQSFRFMIENS